MRCLIKVILAKKEGLNDHCNYHPYLFSTLTGYLFALWFRDKLELIPGFSAGSLIGVCLFDLLPESLKLGQGYFLQEVTVSIIAFGFFLYLTLYRLTPTCQLALRCR